MARQHDSNDWTDEFQPAEREVLRERIPEAIQRTHERSARAQAEYDDPDGDLDVYGTGMALGVPKKLRTLLSDVPSYREVKGPTSRTTLLLIGNALIFTRRVGKQMPGDFRRVRLADLSDSRRELFATTSNVKYSDPGLFDIDDVLKRDQRVSLEDPLRNLGEAIPHITLFVVYYSSTPHGVGKIFFGPARLNDQYLEIVNPERLTYERIPSSVNAPRPVLNPVKGFNDNERPRTQVKLRKQPSEQEGS